MCRSRLSGVIIAVAMLPDCWVGVRVGAEFKSTMSFSADVESVFCSGVEVKMGFGSLSRVSSSGVSWVAWVEVKMGFGSSTGL